MKSLPVTFDELLVLKINDKKKTKYLSYFFPDIQYKRERSLLHLELLKTNVLCSSKSYNPSTIDYLKLKEIVKGRYFDPIVLEIQTCAVNAWVPFPKTKYRNIKLFWGDLVNISEGVQGNIAVSRKSNISDIFIIKYPIKSEDPDINIQKIEEMTHEMFVVSILNRYRTKIPNFVYMFGYFECNTPLIIDNRRSLCNLSTSSENKNTPFVILEKINGPTLKEYLQDDPKITDILNYYLQVLMSLETAQDINFSHNDLHTGNVMLRPSNSDKISVHIKYDLGTKYYLKTDTIATIIDFGLSYLGPIRGEVYGIDYYQEHNIYPDHPNRLMDAYKLLMFIGKDLIFSAVELKKIIDKETNPVILEELNKDYDYKIIRVSLLLKQLKPLFDFFIKANMNEIQTYILDTNNSLYTFPDLPSYTHAKFIKYIIRTYDINFVTTTKPDKVLGLYQKDNLGLLKPPNYSPIELFYLIQQSVIKKKKLDKYKDNIGTQLTDSIKQENNIIDQMFTLLLKANINKIVAKKLVSLYYTSRILYDINITVHSYVTSYDNILAIPPNIRHQSLLLSIEKIKNRYVPSESIYKILNSIRDNSMYSGPEGKHNRDILRLKINISNQNFDEVIRDIKLIKTPDLKILDAIINSLSR